MALKDSSATSPTMAFGSECRIKCLHRAHGIRCKQVKKFKATTKSDHLLPVAENLLCQNIVAEVPNQVLVAYITYIPTAGGVRWFLTAASLSWIILS